MIELMNTSKLSVSKKYTQQKNFEGASKMLKTTSSCYLLHSVSSSLFWPFRLYIAHYYQPMEPDQELSDVDWNRTTSVSPAWGIPPQLRHRFVQVEADSRLRTPQLNPLIRQHLRRPMRSSLPLWSPLRQLVSVDNDVAPIRSSENRKKNIYSGCPNSVFFLKKNLTLIGTRSQR